MAAPKHPSLRLRFYHEKFPSSEGTDIYRWGQDPLADSEFTEGRVTLDSWGDLEWALSGHEGHYQGASLSFSLNDEDGMMGALFAGATTQFLTNREATLEILSVDARKAGADWRPLLHGRITEMKPGPNFTIHGELRDMLSAEFAPMSLDRPAGRVFIADTEHPLCPVEMLGEMYPWVIGEHSDKGTIAIGGANAEQGALPLRIVGYQNIQEDGTLGTPGGKVYVQPPRNLIAVVVGTPGTRVVRYAVSGITELGETVASAIVTVTNAPNILDVSNYIHLTWQDPILYGSQIQAFRVMGRGATPPNRYLAIMSGLGTYLNPEHEYFDQGQDVEKLPAASLVPTAIAITQSGSGLSQKSYGEMLIGLGAIKPTAFFASDLGGPIEIDPATGEILPKPASKRIQIPMDHDDVVSPWLDDGTINPMWPHPDPWVETNGIRWTPIYVTGGMLAEHESNTVTMAVNACGYDPTGDQTGDVVDQAGEAMVLIFNELILKDGGLGYRGGSFGPLEVFIDGTPIVKTSSFTAFQDMTKRWIGGSGYKMSYYVEDKKVTVRDIIRQTANTFGCYYSAIDYGQIVMTAPDDQFTGTATPYREHIEVVEGPRELEPADISSTDVHHKREFKFHYLPDARRWRNLPQQITDETAREAARGALKSLDTIECWASNDRATVEDSQARQLGRLAYQATYQSWMVGLMGLEQQFDPNPVALTHRGGGVGGYVNHPFWIIKKRYLPNVQKVKLTGWSMGRLLGISMGGGTAIGGGSLGPVVEWFMDTDSEFTDTGASFR